MQFQTFDQMKQHVGQEIALSDWLTITQDRITGFAHVTDDPDWMHVDVERARRGDRLPSCET